MRYRQLTYGKVIGSISDITVYSFYVTKTMATATATATGEGEMVTTENKDYLSRIKTMRLHGINRDVSTVILPINLHGSMK